MKARRYAVAITSEGEITICEEQTKCPPDAPDPDVYPGHGSVPTWVNLWAIDEARARLWAMREWRTMTEWTQGPGGWYCTKCGLSNGAPR